MSKFGSYQGLRNSRNKKKNYNKLTFQESAEKLVKIKRKNDNGITVSSDIRLAVVRPTESYKPSKSDVKIFTNLSSTFTTKTILNKLSGVVAVDIETRGTAAHNPECQIVGVGFADSQYIYYFDFLRNTNAVNQIVLEWMRNYQGGFVGHNVFFDGTFLQRDSGTWLNWKYDTYGMYMQLSNEGYRGQSWSLKTAQVQLLNWEEKGDVELDQWLVDNDLYKDIKKEKVNGNYYQGPDFRDGTPRWYRPNKGEMWQAPAEILGYYCGLDVASTYQLLTEVFLPSIQGEAWEQEYIKYHQVFMNNVKYHAAQQLSGITIDKPMLIDYHKDLILRIEEARKMFLEHPNIREILKEYNLGKVKEQEDKEPAKYLKEKPLGKEPAQFKKNGEESKVWQKWMEKKIWLENKDPEVSKNWTNWNEKLKEIASVNHFNLNSGKQLQWLFYERLDMPVIIRTESGEASTGVQALPGFGEIGKLLGKYKDLEKELGYVSTCLEHLRQDEHGHWRLHPQFRMPGTKTCRLAGSGGINLQQIPKSRGYLECWKPIEGKAWIDCDHTALEQVVLAELSRDASLLNLYGADAKPNDVYLFNAAIMAQRFGVKLFQPILSEGYDPFDPDPEAIKRCKKNHKNLRGISKTASLGKSYGMGWAKFQLNMKLQGVEMSEPECRAVIDGLDKVYSGVKDYEQALIKEYNQNTCYVLNGIGRPVGCDEEYIKDINNRVIQSTGHDIHMIYIEICQQLFREHNLDVKGIVLDFHDQSIYECNVEDKDIVYELIGTKAYEILNDKYLKGDILLKGDPQHIETMACAKCG